ncbi:MAG: glycosyltransferase [Acidobacteria bacterium]|nr:glycosyltransferase [Acidobacteriota bacterium]
MSRTVTLVGPFPPPLGGVSVHLHRLEESLISRGWHVLPLAAGRSRPEQPRGQYFLGNSLVRHFTVVRRRSRGVVHVHNRVGILTLVAVLAARAAGLPTVVTVHGNFQRTYPRGPDWISLGERTCALRHTSLS